MKDNQLELYLENKHKHGLFDYENEGVHTEIIDCIKNAGIKEECYFETFVRILAHIERGDGSPDFDRTNGKQVNRSISSQNNMVVFFEPIPDSKFPRKVRFNIYKIMITEGTINKIKLNLKTVYK